MPSSIFNPEEHCCAMLIPYPSMEPESHIQVWPIVHRVSNKDMSLDRVWLLVTSDVGLLLSTNRIGHARIIDENGMISHHGESEDTAMVVMSVPYSWCSFYNAEEAEAVVEQGQQWLSQMRKH